MKVVFALLAILALAHASTYTFTILGTDFSFDDGKTASGTVALTAVSESKFKRARQDESANGAATYQCNGDDDNKYIVRVCFADDSSCVEEAAILMEADTNGVSMPKFIAKTSDSKTKMTAAIYQATAVWESTNWVPVFVPLVKEGEEKYFKRYAETMSLVRKVWELMKGLNELPQKVCFKSSTKLEKSDIYCNMITTDNEPRCVFFSFFGMEKCEDSTQNIKIVGKFLEESFPATDKSKFGKLADKCVLNTKFYEFITAMKTASDATKFKQVGPILSAYANTNGVSANFNRQGTSMTCATSGKFSFEEATRFRQILKRDDPIAMP